MRRLNDARHTKCVHIFVEHFIEHVMVIVHHQVNIQRLIIIDISKAGNEACQLNDTGSNKNIASAHWMIFFRRIETDK